MVKSDSARNFEDLPPTQRCIDSVYIRRECVRKRFNSAAFIKKGHPVTWAGGRGFTAKIVLATHAYTRVQSDCLLPGTLAALSQDSLVFLSRALWSRPSQTDTTRSSGQITVFSRKPGLWNSSCVHPQASPDCSDSSDTSGAQVSNGVSLFQIGVPGAIVSGSFVRTLSSPTRSSRRPGQDILHECFMGPVQPGFQAQRVPRCLSGSRLAQKIRSQVSLVSLDNGA